MPRVLVVDDNPMNAHLAKLMLGRAGWDTMTVDSAQAALDQLAAALFDVVVTDISMPGMSGNDLCREIHRRYGDDAPGVVAFTAFAMEHQKQAIMEAGFDAIVVKPVTADSLLAAVRGAATRGASNAPAETRRPAGTEWSNRMQRA